MKDNSKTCESLERKPCTLNPFSITKVETIKAKLEAVESGISIFEDEFMANIVLPNGQTISEYIMPQLEQIYLNNSMPLLLPMLSNQKEKSIC